MVSCPIGTYPQTRLRRTRAQQWLRELVRETSLEPRHLILPLFVQEGKNQRTAIATLPGVERLSIDLAIEAAREATALGIPALALFPVTDAALKTEGGDEAFNPKNLICRAIRAIKKDVPQIGIIADVALDPYTSHGQDGLLKDRVILNDETVVALCKQALVQAEAGCDILAPSDMMDGRIGAIRTALEANGYSDTLLLAYSAKYASALYGPFRDAVGSGKNLGSADKKTYQMAPGNSDEAMREMAMDVAEGADMLMVKPAIPYLDIIYRAHERFELPIFAYHVSGEYAMIHAAAEKGILDKDNAMLESLLAIRRAGAQAILTYGARDVARILKEKQYE